MTLSGIIEAIFLGVIEGLTEFIPVSSTGHLLLASHFLGFNSDGTFEVLIQLGAILALLLVYAEKLWRIAVAVPSDKEARHFVIGVLVAFLPAAIMGALFEHKMKEYLFNVHVVCYALIAGGFVLLDTQFVTEHLRTFGATEVPRRRYRAQLDKAITGTADFARLPTGQPVSGVEALGIIAGRESAARP